MKMFLWFVSTSMTFAFVDVAYLHKTPPEALTLGLLVGAASVAMEWSVFARIRRPLGWRS
jgi:hypothetical protein